MFQDDFYDNPNSVDINSEDFFSLSPEIRHEILKDMKEFCKRRRVMYHPPPEVSLFIHTSLVKESSPADTSHCVPFQNSGDFSQYQLAGLLQRNQLNQRLEGVEKEMTERSTGSTSQLYQQNGQDHSVESRRLVSEDNSHYILIKGEDGRVRGHVLVSITQGRGHQRGAP